MTWSQEAPLGRVVHDLLNLKLRAERLGLVAKLQAAETQARMLGVSTEPFERVRRALGAHPLLGRDTSIRVPPAPLVTPETPIRRIAVRTRPGSVF